jgi:hypothetical protein
LTLGLIYKRIRGLYPTNLYPLYVYVLIYILYWLKWVDILRINSSSIDV